MKRTFLLLMICLLFATQTLTVNALTKPDSRPGQETETPDTESPPANEGPGEQPEDEGPGIPSGPGGIPGGFGGGIDWESGQFGGEIDFPYNHYTPKVTSLRSVNAALANYDGASVYFIPRLEDFPTDLTETVTNLTDRNGVQHRFAVVYGGYFNTDVDYIQAYSEDPNVSRLMTSKKVYSAEDNSRLLNLVGYDLLLRSEQFVITTGDGLINMEYNPVKVGNSYIDAQTAIMDLYKAVGVYEWDIQFAYGIDEDFDANSSPILQQIGVLTSLEGTQGFDTSESLVWVAATRTNPEQYWQRCLNDAIFDGGLHTVTAGTGTYVGSETSVSRSYGRYESLSLGEFCTIARAIMTLYGEPVMTREEMEACVLAYGMVLPDGGMDPEIRDAILYLTAKGIIDPSEKNFNADITFASIEDILLRIADKDSRLTIKTTNLGVLASKGFAKIDEVTLVSPDTNVQVINTTDLQYLDFLVELNSSTAFYITRAQSTTYIPTSTDPKLSALPITLTSNFQNGQIAMSTQNMVLNGRNQSDGIWRLIGIETHDNKDYYHFKVNTVLLGDSITFDYYPDESRSEEIYQGEAFTLPNSNGGVYSLTNGSWTYNTFEELGYDNTYFDNSNEDYQRWRKELQMDSMQLIVLDTTSNALAANASLLTADHPNGIQWDNIFQGNIPVTSERRSITGNGSSFTAFATSVSFAATSSNSDRWRIEIYTTDVNKIINSIWFKAVVQNTETTFNSGNDITGFYRGSDNTLLVSVTWLNSVGLVQTIDELGDGVYVMHVKNGGTESNVIIYDNKTNGFIMVGDTLYPKRNSSEVLLEHVGSTTYINYKALIGWSESVVLIPTGSTSSIMALGTNSFRINRYEYEQDSDYWTNSNEVNSQAITSITDGTSLYMSIARIYSGKKRDGQVEISARGLSMISSYALSPYIIVSCNDNGYDYLFTYHIRDFGNPDTSTESEALAKFEELTGFRIESDETYCLYMYKLNIADHKKATGVSMNDIHRNGDTDLNNDGFTYATRVVKSRNLGDVETAYGWVYSIPVYNDIRTAIEAYANCETRQLLPFAMLNDGRSHYYRNNTIYDVNVNAAKRTVNDPYEDPGILFAKAANSKEIQLVEITSNGKIQKVYPAVNLSENVVMIPAPAGAWSTFKGDTNMTIKDIARDNQAIYYGTMKAYYNKTDNALYVDNLPLSVDGSTPVSRTYLGTYGNTVYVVNGMSIGLTRIIDKFTDQLSAIIHKPRTKVDWDRFKFERLVYEIDGWSTVLLIFILNLLPRACMFLFMCLLVLSMIANVKPWQKFCNNTFDVYKFLTLGHVSVQTVNTKRLFITSIACLAIFFMIMDGLLFEFIIWFSQVFLIWMQN